MKNLVKSVFMISAVITLSSCNKDDVKSNSSSLKMATTSEGIIIPAEENLMKLYTSTPYQAGLIGNSNFGILPKGGDMSLMMMSAPIADIDFNLSGQKFNFSKEKQVTYSNSELLNLFGKVHPLSITTKEGSKDYKFYIPEMITVKKLGEDNQSIVINRTGNTLTWKPDSKYPTKVVFSYMLYKGNALGGEEPIYRNALIVEDNGKLNIDEFLSNHDAKAINFSIYRINALEVNTDGKKIALAFTSVDHHVYDIQD